MAAPSVRGTPSWTAHDGLPVWPAGTQAGDWAFLIVLHRGMRYPGHEGSEFRWSPPGRWRLLQRLGMDWGQGGQSVWAIQVPATGRDSLLARQKNSQQMLVVFRDAGGVGRVRQGMEGVSVGAESAALVVVGNSLPGGLTALAASADNGTTYYGRLYPGWGSRTTPGYVGGTFRYTERSIAVEVEPTRSPRAPLILSPVTGVDIATTDEEIVLRVQHQPTVQGGRADAVKVQSSTNGGATWTTRVDANVSPTGLWEGAVPTSLFSTGQQVTWRAQTRETLNGLWSPQSAFVAHRVVAPPSMTLTGPASPVVDDLSPTVTWTAVTPGGEQIGYQIRVLDGATTIYDSRPITSPDSEHTVPASTPWVRLTDYMVRGRVQQTGGAWSPWVDMPLGLDWAAPATPAVAVADDPDSGGVTVTVTAEQATMVQIWRDLDGARWPVWSGDMGPSATTITVVDVFGPHATPATYVAVATRELDGIMLPSDEGTSVPIARAGRCAYIASAWSPAETWIPWPLTADGVHVTTQRINVHYPLGTQTDPDEARMPVIVQGPTQGRRGDFDSLEMTRTAHRQLEALLLSGDPLLVCLPAEDTLGEPGPGWLPGEVITMARTSEYASARWAHGPWQPRTSPWSWVEQHLRQPDPTRSQAPVTSPAVREI